MLWATGFDGDYTWLRLPGVLDDHGRPLHEEGASPWPGLFFMGLPWMTRRRSTLISGVEVDAPWIAGLVAERLGVAMPAEASSDDRARGPSAAGTLTRHTDQ